MSFEHELIKYKQKIANILESFTDAFFEVDLDWKVTYWNKECERLLGKSKAEIVGKNLWVEFKRAISLKFYTEYHRAMHDNVAVRFQEYWPQKKMWVEVSAFPSGEGLSVYFKDITDWKRINKQLAREKKRYYDLFNHSPLPQWVYDFKTLSILQVNDAAIKQYGYSRKEFLKMTLKDIRPPEDVSTLTQILDNNILKGRFNSSVVRHRKKNGEIIYVSVDGNSVFFDNKNARLVMAVDQTEQIKAELELSRSEQRFKALVQDGSDLIGILDSQGNYKYVSPTTKQILGVEAAHFIGKNAFDFIHPEDRFAALLQFDRLVNEKQVKLAPFRFADGRGTYRWIETVVTNLHDDPAIEGIVSNSRDITGRVESELNTEELLNRYNIVSKATSDAIWDWDMESGKIHWNQAIKGVYGYRNTCFDTNWWAQQIHPDDFPKVEEQFNQLIRSKKSRLQLEYRFRCADGTYKCVLDRSFVLFDREGKPTRMIGSMEDITERIAHIKAIEDQNARLHEIAWAQAHDVRAPLAKIIGLVNLLESNTSADALANIISHLKRSTNDLDKVIKRMINKPD
ncbi:PAS domain S-box protein [Pedobacter heparinus]|uniref:PAS domain S-box protein n=1 Tax=Pedobacter heparinus TaxID=984 RepID=UPI002930141D|nr:PAS domain S-box protein [Pedobacter heparinus]